jgi:hypothetical protein
MPDRQWYVASDEKQYGPFSDQQLRQLVAERKVRADTFVWCEGMTDWAQAADIPGLIPATRPPSAPPARAATPSARAAAPADGEAHALSTTVELWPLFGRVVLLFLGIVAVIPLPWVAVNFLQWFVDRIDLPEQQRVAFAGKVEDVRNTFFFYALWGWVTLVGSSLLKRGIVPSFVPTVVVEVLFLPVTVYLAITITRWFYANLVWERQSAPLQFTGEYKSLLGWMVLSAVSVITIVGWAWVYTAWTRWMCANVRGANREFVFTASGLEFLWRSLLFALSCSVLVPIPWTLRWYVRWLVSQFALRG